ncbi:glycoside hydrolase family 3 N-terminal domain-containing protein, partial [Bacteroides ovatus]
MRKRIIATSLNKKRFLSGVFLTLLATVVNAQPFPYQQAGLPVSQRVDDLMKRMTLEEKIAQIRHLHSWDIFNEQTLDKEKLTAVVGETGYGFVEGFPLTGENCRSSMREIQEYMLTRTRLGIPAFTVAESLHGSAHEGSTIFPQNIALGSTFNPALAYRRACMTADDLHAQGMRQVLAPCIDVVRDLRWGRVEESYGEDPYLCGIFAQSEVKGYLDSGISPMLKHYGPHGNPLGGLNLASVDCGLYDLHAVYLKPFEMVLRHFPVYAVMSTYNSWNRIPNSASRYLLTDILRDRWGFKGYVYSDWGAIEMLETFHHTAANKAEAATQALTAGLDVEASSECYPELFRLVKEGKLDESYIDTAVRRVLTAKFEYGLFEDPYGNKCAASGEMHSLRSVELSRQIAEESIVLLKNEKNLLPLDMNKLTSIAILGPNADQVQFGDYTWSRDNKDGITPLQGIKALVGEKIKINHAVGCSMMSRDTTGIGEAVKVTLKSDVAVIFCGSSSASLARDYTRTNCGEGFDLSDLSLTGAQSDLIQAVYATGKPVILVLVSGKPFAISWEKEHIPAIVA